MGDDERIVFCSFNLVKGEKKPFEPYVRVG